MWRGTSVTLQSKQRIWIPFIQSDGTRGSNLAITPFYGDHVIQGPISQNTFDNKSRLKFIRSDIEGYLDDSVSYINSQERETLQVPISLESWGQSVGKFKTAYIQDGSLRMLIIRLDLFCCSISIRRASPPRSSRDMKRIFSLVIPFWKSLSDARIDRERHRQARSAKAKWTKSTKSKITKSTKIQQAQSGKSIVNQRRKKRSEVDQKTATQDDPDPLFVP